MAILSNSYTKSNNYSYTLTLVGIKPVTGFYKTALTGTHFIRGEKIEAVKTKITDAPRVVVTWPKPKNGVTKYQLSLRGIQSVKSTEARQTPTLKLVGSKAIPTKKAPAVAIVAPANVVLSVPANAQESEAGTAPNGDADDEDPAEDPEHSAALARLMALLENDVALNLAEELEEEEAEQEEQIDWVEDPKGFDATMRPLAVHGLGGDDLTEVNDKFETTKANFLKMMGTVDVNKTNVLKPVIGGEPIEASLASNTNNDFNKHPCAVANGATGIYSKKTISLNNFLAGVQQTKDLKLNWVREKYLNLKHDRVAVRPEDTVHKFVGKIDGNNKYDKLELVKDFTGVLDDTHFISRSEETTTAEALRVLKNSGNEEDFIELRILINLNTNSG